MDKNQDRITIYLKIQRLFGSNWSICSYDKNYERAYVDDGYHASAHMET